MFSTRRGEQTLDPATFTGTTLLDAVRHAGLPLGQSCRGEGICRSCAIEILAGAEQLAPPSALELRQLRPRPGEPDDPHAPTQRLACQAPIPAPTTTVRLLLAHPAWGRPLQGPGEPSDGSPAPAPDATVAPDPWPPPTNPATRGTASGGA